MSTEKNKTMGMATRKLLVVVKNAYQYVSMLFDEERLSSVIQQRLAEAASAFGGFDKVISVDAFQKYLRSPQINDLLGFYLTYCLLDNLMRSDEQVDIRKEDIYTYLIKIIETNFENLADSDTITAVRAYFDCLVDICSREFGDNIFSKQLKEFASSDRELFDKLMELYQRIVKEPIAELNRKMTEILKIDFVPRNNTYDTKKREYNRGIQQLFQNGFIYLLGEHKLQEFYIPPKLVPARTRRSDTSSQIHVLLTRNILELSGASNNWSGIFNQQNIVYVIGGAGYGKSLFLKNIVNNASKLDIEYAEDYLLIFCDLKSYYADGNDTKTITSFLQESMVKLTGLDGLTTDFIQYNLQLGRCIVLLDALDEVPKRGRKDLHKKIVSFFKNNNPSNKICITSRDRGFIPEKNIEAYEIEPLTPKEIEAYLDRMISLKKFKKEDKERFMEQAQALINKEFLNSFLILSLLVNIYKSERELPENKIDLYKKCFEYIAKKREEEKSKTGYDWHTIYPLMKDSTFISLAVLAAPNNHDIPKSDIESLLLSQYKNKYIDEATTESAIQEFLEFCSNRTELFVPSSVDDKFKFFHRSFFEYFYARYIFQQPNIQDMYRLMSEFDIDSEVFELTVALVKEDNEEKYQKLISYIFKELRNEFASSSYSSVKCTAFGILTLAMQVVDDAAYINEYFEEVMTHSAFMTNQTIARMNQSLICMGLEKSCGNDKNKQKRFVEQFKTLFAQYISLMLADISSSKTEDLILARTKKSFVEYMGKHFDIQLIIAGKDLPFYVVLCGRYNDYQCLMDDFITTGIQTILSTTTDKKKKSAIKKGFNNYLKMSGETKEAFFRSLTWGNDSNSLNKAKNDGGKPQ